jgi:hypothetical protein
MHMRWDCHAVGSLCTAMTMSDRATAWVGFGFGSGFGAGLGLGLGFGVRARARARSISDRVRAWFGFRSVPGGGDR